jgi:hypothetical protein
MRRSSTRMTAASTGNAAEEAMVVVMLYMSIWWHKKCAVYEQNLWRNKVKRKFWFSSLLDWEVGTGSCRWGLGSIQAVLNGILGLILILTSCLCPFN